MKTAFATVALTLGISFPLSAPEAADPPMQAAFDNITARGPSDGATWSAMAVSLETGETLFARNVDMPLAPASNIKLFTTAAALHILGANFRYRTFLLGTGPVVNGTLQGDLILYGTGDPALSKRFARGGPDPLSRLADEAAALGIQRIDGDIIADGSFLGGPGRSTEWLADDLDDWFAAPVAGLSFNENLVTLRTAPGEEPGRPPQVQVLPEIGREQVENEALTRAGRGRPDLVVTRSEPSGPIRIIGSISAAQRPIWTRITVSDPTRFAGEALRGLLHERGVVLGGVVRTVGDTDVSRVASAQTGDVLGESVELRTLATYESPPLLQYLNVINRESHNFFAESVFKTLGRVAGGEGTFDGGRRVVGDFLEDFAGVPANQVSQRDGSGLSPSNQASAQSFVRLLTASYGSAQREDFLGTLPVAGTRRELGRMYQTPAAGNLRAKTGTIARVSALSGYVTSADGEPIAFSLISNGIRSRSVAKRLEDQLGSALSSFRREGS